MMIWFLRLLLWIGIVVLVAGGATAITMLAFVLAVSYVLFGHSDYRQLQIMRDERTGLFIELGRVETMLDVDFFLLVFEDDSTRTEISSSGSPAIVMIAKFGSDTDVLSYEDGCYVVTTEWGELEAPAWRDPRTGEELCFRVRLEPAAGPRWKP
jgi:hypothetical protein